MVKEKKTTFSQYYLGAHFICLLAFLFPASKLTIGGQAYTQYLLTSYPGWVVLSVLVVLLSIEVLYFLKTHKWPSWLGVICGLYCGSYALMLIWKGYTRFEAVGEDTLVKKLSPSSTPLTGLWLLTAGGLLLFMVAGLKIYQNRSVKLPLQMN